MRHVLADVLRKAPLTPEKVSFAWRIAVGPAMARVTTVRLSDDGGLVVSSRDAHWRKEVRRSSRVILPRLAEMLGDGTVTRLEAR